jgi:GDP-4-dehydro-6-deoxy-D-mannose reductase
VLSLAQRSILITGAAGFVGPYAARALAARGARVHGLGNEAPRETLPLESWQMSDLLDPAALDAAIAATRPDAVLHLAGQSSAGRSFQRPVETFEANAMGTWRLLEAVHRAAPRARVLAVGTGEVYGPQPHGSRVGEEAPFRPVSPYALSKAAADTMAQVAGTRLGIDVVRVRAFGHAGPGQRPPFVIPSWAEQIAAIERGDAEPVLRVGELRVTRDLSDVRDVVLGYAALFERGKSGGVYNLCRGAGVELTEVVRALVARSRVPIRIEPDPSLLRPADVPWLVGDPGRIEAECGWHAAIELERTLTDVLDEWRAGA